MESSSWKLEALLGVVVLTVAGLFVWLSVQVGGGSTILALRSKKIGGRREISRLGKLSQQYAVVAIRVQRRQTRLTG